MLGVLDRRQPPPTTGSLGPPGDRRAASASAASGLDDALPAAGDRADASAGCAGTTRRTTPPSLALGSRRRPPRAPSRPAPADARASRSRSRCTAGSTAQALDPIAAAALAPLGLTVAPEDSSAATPSAARVRTPRPARSGSAVAVDACCAAIIQLSAIGTADLPRRRPRAALRPPVLPVRAAMRLPLSTADPPPIVANDAVLGSARRCARRDVGRGRRGTAAPRSPDTARRARRGMLAASRSRLLERGRHERPSALRREHRGPRARAHAGGRSRRRQQPARVRRHQPARGERSRAWTRHGCAVRGASAARCSCDVVAGDHPATDRGPGQRLERAAALPLTNSPPQAAPALDSVNVGGRRGHTARDGSGPCAARACSDATRCGPDGPLRVQCELERAGAAGANVAQADAPTSPEELPDGQLHLRCGRAAAPGWRATGAAAARRATASGLARRRLAPPRRRRRATDGLYAALFAASRRRCTRGRDCEHADSALVGARERPVRGDRSRRGDAGRPVESRSDAATDTMRGELRLHGSWIVRRRAAAATSKTLA